MGAVVASLDMSAERSGATDLYGRHDAPLGEAQMGLVGRAPAGPVAAENIPPPPGLAETSSAYQAGAVISMFRSSSGLWIWRMVLIATRA
jgi:hypothetical protein